MNRPLRERPTGRRFLRCPGCGKLSQADKFGRGARGEHALEGKVQTSLSRPGRKGGFSWRSVALEADDLELLREALRGAEAGVAQALGAKDLTDAQEREKIRELESEIRKRDKLLLLAAEEIRSLSRTIRRR